VSNCQFEQKRRAVELPTVFPWRTYDDAHAADRISRDGVRRNSARPDVPATRGAGGRGTGLYIAIDDPDAHCAQARAAGAEILSEPEDLGYSREYSAQDPEGNAWHFGTYQPFGTS
jgi:uncharacterized glyoxalase superfamily protein PhnB